MSFEETNSETDWSITQAVDGEFYMLFNGCEQPESGYVTEVSVLDGDQEEEFGEKFVKIACEEKVFICHLDLFVSDRTCFSRKFTVEDIISASNFVTKFGQLSLGSVSDQVGAVNSEKTQENKDDDDVKEKEIGLQENTDNDDVKEQERCLQDTTESEACAPTPLPTGKSVAQRKKIRRRSAGEISGRQIAIKRLSKEGCVLTEGMQSWPPQFVSTVKRMREVLLEFAEGKESNYSDDEASALRVYFCRMLNVDSQDGTNSVLTSMFKVVLLPKELYEKSIEICELYEAGHLEPPTGSKQRKRRRISSSSFTFLRGLNPRSEVDQKIINDLLVEWKETKLRPKPNIRVDTGDREKTQVGTINSEKTQENKDDGDVKEQERGIQENMDNDDVKEQERCLQSATKSKACAPTPLPSGKSVVQKKKITRRKAGEISGRQIAIKRLSKEGCVLTEGMQSWPPQFLPTVKRMREVLLEFAEGKESNFTDDEASALRVYFCRMLNVDNQDGTNSVLTSMFKVVLLPKELYEASIEVCELYEAGHLEPPTGSKQRKRRRISSSSFTFLRGLDPRLENDQEIIHDLLVEWKETKIRPKPSKHHRKTTASKGNKNVDNSACLHEENASRQDLNSNSTNMSVALQTEGNNNLLSTTNKDSEQNNNDVDIGDKDSEENRNDVDIGQEGNNDLLSTTNEDSEQNNNDVDVREKGRDFQTERPPIVQRKRQKRRRAGEISGRQVAIKRLRKEGCSVSEGTQIWLPQFLSTVKLIRKVLLEFSEGKESNFTDDEASAMRVYFVRLFNVTKNGYNSTLTGMFKVALLPKELYEASIEICELYEAGHLEPPTGSKQRKRQSVSCATFSFLRGLDPRSEADQKIIHDLLVEWKETKIRPTGPKKNCRKTTTSKEASNFVTALDSNDVEQLKQDLETQKREVTRLTQEIELLRKKYGKAEEEICQLKGKLEYTEEELKRVQTSTGQPKSSQRKRKSPNKNSNQKSSSENMEVENNSQGSTECSFIPPLSFRSVFSRARCV